VQTGMTSPLQNNAKILCEHCHSLNIRQSKWSSHTERDAHPRCTPYRCLDCSKRFISTINTTHLIEDNTLLKRASIVGIVLAVVLIFMFLVFVNGAKNSQQKMASETLSEAAKNSTRLKAAENGDARAQFELGQSLLQSFSDNPDEMAIAVRWLSKSADQGNTNAMVALGRLSKVGLGVLQSYEQSLEWMKAAAHQGNSDGMLELGRLYREGIAVPKDIVQAYIWLNRSAAKHNRIAAHERDVIGNALTPEQLKEAQSQSVTQAQVKSK
jgi:TPR repeat protein